MVCEDWGFITVSFLADSLRFCLVCEKILRLREVGSPNCVALGFPFYLEINVKSDFWPKLL